MTSQKYLIDSNIFIDAFHGEAKAQAFLKHNKDRTILYFIVYFEVIKGSLNKNEYSKTRKFFDQLAFDAGRQEAILKAMEIVDKHLLSNGIELFDAMIAATAIVNNYTLVTRDVKHMGKIEGLKIKKI